MDRYVVLRKIGAGSFGDTFLVADRAQQQQQQYVLKRITCAAPGAPPPATEVALLASLHHPFVLGLVDDFVYHGEQQQQQHCIVTEYCEGGDLQQHLQAGRQLALPQLMAWLAQLLLALEHLHSRGILHRDVKTPNIFITAAGHIKLGDFGAARCASSC